MAGTGCGRLDGSTGAPPEVLAGWDAFRAQLENHHSAEDDDLWPVLRRELSDPGELASVDAMAEEHRQIPRRWLAWTPRYAAAVG
jgi:hypothetical protein